MKIKLPVTIIAIALLLSFPKLNFAQAPNLGTASSFVLFTAVGNFTNVGASNVTGNVGTNVGAYSAFPPGTLVGQSHVADTASVQAATDVDSAYGHMSGITCDTVVGTTLGNGQVLTARVYCLGAASTLNDTLFLNAQGNSSALFIFKINGALATSTHAFVKLMNSASRCNVYWQINGAFTLNDSSVFEGTVLAAGAITLNTRATLNGRALTTSGAINASAVTATIPSSCSNNPPSITTQPVNQNVCSGSATGFAVTATGTGLTYQWRKGTVNLTNTGNIAGATSASLTINPATIADTASNYNVVVSGTYPPASISTNVSLTMNSAPAITTAPVSHAACSGSSTGFAVTATGTALTYQWRKGTVNLTNTGNITGATSASLTINPATIADTASNYNVVISGTCSPVNTSANVSLTVNTAPAITTAPANQTACSGSSTGFAVTATGTALTYQWRKGTVNLTNTGNIIGATSASLTINPATIADTASNYNVVISGTCSPVNTSANVSLTMNSAPAITTAPVSHAACSGSSTGFAVTATGTALTYQWRKGTVNLTNTGNITGATSASLIINPATIADTASNYNVVISGTCSPVNTSANVSLTVNTAPAITTAPANQTACSGSSAGFAVTATGTALTYQWRKGTVNLTNTGNITGATSASLTINPATIADTASNYNVVISGTCSPVNTSANVSLTMNSAPAITTAPVSHAACSGSSTGFAVTATGTALTYQWRKGTVNLTNTGNITGATSASLTINPATIADTASNYNVVISGTCSPVSTSANVSLTVNNAPAITTAPANQTACSGSSAGFAVTATGTALTYQWRKGTVNLTNTGNITGATSASLTINPATIADTASNYNVVISGTCSPVNTSANVSLTVNIAPAITTAPANQTACSGSSTGFAVTATGTALTYQWRKGTVNLTNTGNITGATSASLTINPATIADTASNYNVVISGTCSPVNTSANVSLTVNIAPAISTAPVNQTACSGSSAGFAVTATGTALTYQWRKGTVNLTNIGNITGATSASLTINPATIADTASNYNVVISGTCSPVSTSANVSLTVNIAPAITTAPANQTACSGSSTGFAVTATGTALTYQWRKGTVNLTNTGNITGATSASLIINPVSVSDDASDYNVVISGTCSPVSTSANVSLTVNIAPAITTAPINQTACSGSSTGFAVTATGTALTYQWRKGTVNLTNTGNITGATSASLIINPVSVSDDASDYNVVISGTCSPVSTSANVSLTVNTAPGIFIEPVSQMANDSGSASFSVVATGTGLTYQWRRGTVNLTNGGNISGATSSALTISAVTFSDTAYNYNVLISGTCSPAVTSSNVSLFVCECLPTGIASLGAGNTDITAIYPNPFTTSINIIINDASQINEAELGIYNVLGAEVMHTKVSKQLTTLNTGGLPPGMYFYKVNVNNKIVQSGKLISQ